MNFGIYCSLYYVLTLFLKLKKYICAFYIGIQSLKYFWSTYCSCLKLEHNLWLAKLGDYHVWVLTNPINSQAQAQLWWWGWHPNRLWCKSLPSSFCTTKKYRDQSFQKWKSRWKCFNCIYDPFWMPGTSIKSTCLMCGILTNQKIWILMNLFNKCANFLVKRSQHQ